MSRIIKILSFTIIITMPYFVAAQPCLSGWQYRKAIEINNNDPAATNVVVPYIMDSKSLLVEGKMLLNGSDIRFLDQNGQNLDYWIDPATFNSNQSEIWIFMNDLPAGTSIIYLFYGNNEAVPISNGERIFAFFDDFSGSSINSNKWNTCKSASGNIYQSGGELVLTSQYNEQVVITSKNEYSGDLMWEVKFSQFNDVDVFSGFLNAGNQGYAMYYNQQGTMQLKIAKNAADGCLILNSQAPSPNATDAYEVEGIWQFGWKEKGKQYFDWPGSLIHPAERNDQTHDKPVNLHPFLGITSSDGTVRIDWVRLRSTNQPDVSFFTGSEEVVGINITASSNGPLCSGEDLQLLVSGVPGASYSWSGPNGFVSSVQNPVLLNASDKFSGTYQVQVKGVSNCASVISQVEVIISPRTEPGNITGNARVCATGNQGEIRISDYTGSIIRWETSNAENSPWTTINETGDILPYEDLEKTSKYRAIIKSGTCESLPGNAATITVDAVSKGGYIAGSGSVCPGNNSVDLQLADYFGGVAGWQESTDQINWNSINKTDPKITVKDLLNDIYYRAIVQNGTCPPVESAVFELAVNPLPDVNFTFENECQGHEVTFTNNSVITTGAINSYVWDFGDGGNSVDQYPEYVFDESGNHEVVLKAFSNRGCVDSLKKVITIHPLPQPDFSFNNACEGKLVDFSNQTSIKNGSIDHYFWKFGEVGNSDLVNPSFEFTEAGDIEVNLLATSSYGCLDSVKRTVTIYPKSDLDFEVENACLGQPVKFINNSSSTIGSLSFEWEFGDGTSSKQINPSHLYEKDGEFLVTLKATSALSCIDEKSKTISIYPQPEAEFSVDDVCISDSARLVNNSFISSGKLFYNWKFGDGNFSYDKSPDYRYQKAGLYEVKLEVSSENGCTDQSSQFVDVLPQPKAAFIANNACLGNAITFENLTEDKEGLEYSWNFGDGNYSSQPDPEHFYESAQVYQATLYVLSEMGCRDSLVRKVEVYPLPKPSFVAEEVCDGSLTTFINRSTITQGNIKSYLWNFGDGSNAIITEPVKQYLNPGKYQVMLSATSDKGCEASFGGKAVVHEIPIARFEAENVCSGEDVIFHNDSDIKAGDKFYWSFGDGSHRNEKDPFHKYAEPGDYRVKLRITSETGCMDSTYHQVKVYEPSFTSISPDTVISKGYHAQLMATGGIKYLWEPIDWLDNSDIPNPVATPAETTTFSVFITDKNNCRIEKQVTVEVKEDYKLIPSNVMTPDGNGQNDYWHVWNIENYPENIISIYNRWGQEVYRESNYKNDWYGTSGKDILPDGTYYYMIRFDNNQEKYVGALSILRNKK